MTDIKHVIAAVGSSSSLSSAEKFIADEVYPSQSTKCTPYSSYEELVKDPNVDIIYIATPHSLHYQNAMLCLKNNKPVLCEKALTVNAAQAKMLYETAKAKDLFLMEAVWTRFLAISQTIRKHITDGDIGDVLRVTSDLSIGINPEEIFGVDHRMVNLDLAGGALLDLGVYSLTWVFQTMYHTLSPQLRAKSRPKVLGTGMVFEPRTGADESTTILLEFPMSTPGGKMRAHAIATTSMRVLDDPSVRHTKEVEMPVVRIHGEKGEIQVLGPSFCPKRYRLIPRNGTSDLQVIDRTFEFEGGVHGMVVCLRSPTLLQYIPSLASETIQSK